MLLVDFGESICKFALVQRDGKNMEVRAWGAEDFRSLEYATEYILEKTKNMRGDADPILLSFPSALWRARVLYERIERKNAVARIDGPEKERILVDLQKRVEERLGKEMSSSSGILSSDVVVQKLHTQKHTIDGYLVRDILGFPGAHVDFQVMAVFALVKHALLIDNIIQRFSRAGVAHIVHGAQALEGFSQEKKQDAIYLDMGDECTRVVVVKNQLVAHVDEIRRAGKDFTLHLQEALSLGENTAKDFKERYAKGDFSFHLREGVKKGFHEIAKDLLHLVHKSLATASVSLPPAVFLFGGTSQISEIQEVFVGDAFKDLSFHEEPSISSLVPKDLWDFSGFPGKANPILTPLFLLPYAPLEVRDKKRTSYGH